MEMVETNYKSGHDITQETKTSHTFSFALNRPSNDFQLFIPPGTERISVRISVGRDAKIGAVARLGLPPTGAYSTNADYWALPWVSNDVTTLDNFRGKDLQRQNTGGTIRVAITTVNPRQPKPGEWLFVKILSYDGSPANSLNFTVTVNTAEYNAWYNTNPFNAQGQPSGKPGIEGGVTDPIWNQIGQTSTPSGPGKTVTKGECASTDVLKCMKYGPSYRPVWNDEKGVCECVHKDNGDVKPI